MGLFKKLIDSVKQKKSVAQQIEQKKQSDQVIDQNRFDLGLKKSSNNLKNSIDELAKKYRYVDDDLIEAIEETLLLYDIGTAATQKILDAIVDEIKFQNVKDVNLIKQIIIDKIFVYYIQDTQVNTDIVLRENSNNVILVTGVNGVGKTTSIAKLAYKFKKENKKVLIVAADTFRAAAVEQLEV